MSAPVLSIIVPVYNSERYLVECLDSLCHQTLQDIEIVCVNDGSTDGSLAILQKYAHLDKRIKCIDQPNAGPSKARNEGLKVARAEYVAFVDADDTLEPDAYEKAIACMCEDIDMVCFGIQVNGSSNESEKKGSDAYYKIKYDGKVAVSQDIIQNTDASPCNKIFRRTLLNQYDIVFPEGLRYEDAYFFVVYAIRSKYFYYIPDKFYNYRRSESSFMVQTFAEKKGLSLDHVKIAIRIYEYMKKYGLLEMHRRYVGMLFYGSLDFAFRYEHTKEGEEAIYDLALDFCNRERITWSEYPEFMYPYRALKNKSWMKDVKKSYFFGVFVVKYSSSSKKYCVCGAPIFKVKYRIRYIKYYFCGIPVRKVKNIKNEHS